MNRPLKGIDYILNQTEDVDANVFVMMPSCVPATAIDDNGCTLTAQDMEPYLSKKRILGLGEVMDYISVVKGDEAKHQKLELFSDKGMDMHHFFLIWICRHMRWPELLQIMNVQILHMR